MDQDRRAIFLAKKLAEPFLPSSARRKVEAVGRRRSYCHGCGSSISRKGGYDFKVPLLEGEHVTEDTGTGFVHTAPGHGADDFEIWTAKTRQLQSLGIDAAVPDTVGPDGYYRKDVPLFGGDDA